MLNKKLPYSDKSYWEDRFKNTSGYFDWYVGWNELKETIEPLINFHSKILMVGCGNSKMSEQMYASYYNDIHNIDISESVINMMEETKKNNGFENMKYYVMDATKMDFSNETFDLCIDKGTLDAVLCADTNELGFKLIEEMYRVTKINGFFVIISHTSVDLRLSLFMNILEFGTYELSYKEIQLSFMSEFINSIRSNKGDISIKDALKDKDILLDSLLDVCIKRKSKKDENLDLIDDSSNNQDTKNNLKVKENNGDDKFSKLAVYLKLIKAIKDKKKSKEETENKIKSSLDTESFNIDRTIDKSNEKNKIEDNIDSNIIKDHNDSVKQENNSIRRSSCHCYIFKKVK